MVFSRLIAILSFKHEEQFGYFVSHSVAVSLKFHIQSLMCLALALQNEFDNGSDDNKFAIAEVTTTVRIVQYLGIVIGVLMGKLEIP